MIISKINFICYNNAKIFQGIALNPFVIWLNGFAGSGKSTICRALYDRLKPKIPNLVYIDGDEFREILSKEQKYDKNSRIKVAKKKAILCKILANQDINVICSGISLFKENYDFNRAQIPNLVEIYIKCDFDELVRRDQKGLYSGAINGKIKEVVGVDIEFDEPKADLVIDNSKQANLDEKIDKILYFLSQKNG